MGNLGDHKEVGGGAWEALLDFEPGYRVYFGRDGRRLVLLLTGGDKKSQRKDIKRAKEFWTDYLTLERLLRPFGLRIGLAEVKPRRKGRAA